MWTNIKGEMHILLNHVLTNFEQEKCQNIFYKLSSSKYLRKGFNKKKGIFKFLKSNFDEEYLKHLWERPRLASEFLSSLPFPPFLAD